MNNIVLCGFMGAGKTCVGKEIANMIGYSFLDTDYLIEKENGIKISEIFEIYGEEYFRNLEHEICLKITNMKNCIISTGGGLMTFDRNVNVIRNGNKIFFLDASYPVICKRIGNTNTRPLFKDKEKAKALFDTRKKKYIEVSDYVINGDLSVKETASIVTDIFKRAI